MVKNANDSAALELHTSLEAGIAQTISKFRRTHPLSDESIGIILQAVGLRCFQQGMVYKEGSFTVDHNTVLALCGCFNAVGDLEGTPLITREHLSKAAAIGGIAHIRVRGFHA